MTEQQDKNKNLSEQNLVDSCANLSTVELRQQLQLQEEQVDNLTRLLCECSKRNIKLNVQNVQLQMQLLQRISPQSQQSLQATATNAPQHPRGASSATLPPLPPFQPPQEDAPASQTEVEGESSQGGQRDTACAPHPQSQQADIPTTAATGTTGAMHVHASPSQRHSGGLGSLPISGDSQDPVDFVHLLLRRSSGTGHPNR